jgi:hypothetical protein
LEQERYHGNRAVLIDALLALGAKGELERPLRRFLGVPDPVENGVAAALAAGLSERLGGPAPRDLKRLIGNAQWGEKVRVGVPKELREATSGGLQEGPSRLRFVLRAHNTRSEPGVVRIGRPEKATEYGKSNTLTARKLALIHPTDQLQITLPPSATPIEVFSEIPASLGLAPGRTSEIVVVAEEGIGLAGFAIVPVAAELPPPAPEPWAPGAEPNGAAPSGAASAAPSAAPGTEATP